MRNANALAIGKLASRGGVSVQTIRYYEPSGLVPKPSRAVSGYRLYAHDAVRRLTFICRGNGPTGDCPMLEAPENKKDSL
jgi:hypothetical protein